MKVYVYPADNYGCGWYRMRWPAEAVAAAGDVEVVVVPPGDTTGIAGRVDMRTRRLKDVMAPSDADVVVMQRPVNEQLAQAVPLLRAKGIAVVVDMDDDLGALHPANGAFAGYHPKTEPITTSWLNAQHACRDATLVTTSTPALARRYGPNGHAVVVYNAVPAAFLDVVHPDSEMVGWAGSVHSHPDDLQTVGPAVARLVNSGALPAFHVIGPGAGVARALGVRDDVVTATGLIGFPQWAQSITELGVGLAPLADTRFNEAKSWLKPLEYAAAGVPWIASDRVEYRRLFAHGAGYIVDRPREWERAVRRLVTDSARRHDETQAGRAAAAALTIEGNAWRWAEAWSTALDRQRGVPARSVVAS